MAPFSSFISMLFLFAALLPALATASTKKTVDNTPPYVQAATPARIVSLSRRSITFYSDEDETVALLASSKSRSCRSRSAEPLLEHGFLVHSAFVKANKKAGKDKH